MLQPNERAFKEWWRGLRELWISWVFSDSPFAMRAQKLSAYNVPIDWFEDEDFWRDLYPAMFPAERFAVADQQVKQILALTQFGGSRILDLGCGPGRHSASFAQQGFKMTGVDRSKFLLARARERAAEFSLDVEWIEEDMRRFERAAAFDLACSIFTSFGYFDDENDDLRVLRNVFESMAPGGMFVMDLIGKERLARVPHDQGH